MDYPLFAAAVSRFHSFLAGQGQPGEIRWVFPQDALLVAGEWYIRPRPQTAVVPQVAAAYRDAGGNARPQEEHW